MNNIVKSKKDSSAALLAYLLVASVILAVIGYFSGFDLANSTYSSLKSLFFVPLKQWIFPVIGIAMFGIFFRSPEGKASKFLILFADITLLYLLSTFIANIYTFLTFPLFPFAETIRPLMGSAKTVIFDKVAPSGIPPVILLIIIGLSLSFIFRYVLSGIFASFAKSICFILSKISDLKILQKISFIEEFTTGYQESSEEKANLTHSILLINFIEKFIFKILTIILFLAPIAVFSSFLEILNSRGISFFIDLGRFIASYAAILLSYQFIVMPLVRKIFCYGIDGETYGSFLSKALPVIATAGTTASSVATLSTNIKAAQSMKVEDDMKDKGHNRALMPIGATFNMDGTSISLVIYFLLAANLAGMDVNFWWVILTAVTLSVGTAAVPSASLIMLTSMFSAFSIPVAVTGKLLSIIIAVDPIHDRLRTIVNTWGDLNMVYIVQSKRGIASILRKMFSGKNDS